MLVYRGVGGKEEGEVGERLQESAEKVGFTNMGHVVYACA